MSNPASPSPNNSSSSTSSKVQSPDPTQPRRYSVQNSGDVYSCIIASCSGYSNKKNGYCITHQNQFAVVTQGVLPSNSVSDKIAIETVCFGHSCQGQIRAGYCSRHKQLAKEGDIQSTEVNKSHARSSSTMVGGKKSAPALVAHQLGIPNRTAEGSQVLQLFLDGLHHIYSQMEPHLAAEAIIQECCTILAAERATLFYVDGDELILMIAKGAKNIRLPRSRGIAGYVSLSGETVNILDAYKEEKFDSTFDASTGFRTRNILATPVHDTDGKVIAVLQVINKLQRKTPAQNPEETQKPGEAFTEDDIVLLENLAFHVGVSLRNAQMYEAAKRSEAKVSSLLEIIQMLHSDPSFNSLIFTLTTRSPTLVDADRCTLYLADYSREQLVVMTGDVDIRIPLNKGIAGATATTGQIINIPDCYADSRFNTEVDKKTGYRTKSMLCMPIPGVKINNKSNALMDSEDEEENEEKKTNNPVTPDSSTRPNVIGVLQLINRNDEQPFSKDDENILSTLLSIAGPILQKYSVFKKSNKEGTGTKGANEKAVLDSQKSPLNKGQNTQNNSAKKSFKPSLQGQIKEIPE